MSLIRTIPMGGLEVRITDEAEEDVQALLAETVLGTPGGLRYKMTETHKRVNAYERIFFASLYLRTRLMGTLAICHRITSFQNQQYNSYYIRFFAFKSTVQSGRDASRSAAKRARTEDSIKEKILALFRDPADLELPGTRADLPSLFYAYLEEGNQRSKNIVEQTGMSRIRSLATTAISRFSPGRSAGVSRLPEEEKDLMAGKLRRFYSDHTLFQTDELHYEGNYYVLKEQGEIVAGVQANPTAFIIKEVPGIRGLLFTHVVPKLPLFKEMFSGGRFSFVEMEFFYHAEGKEKKLFELIESVMALQGYHAMLSWQDADSDLYRLLNTYRKGSIRWIFKSNPVLLMSNFSPDVQQQLFFENPAFVQGLDMV